jgi:hypothetical protein
VELLMQNYEQIQESREYVHSMVLDHYEDYQKLYRMLSVEFGRRQQEEWAKTARERFEKLAEGFLAGLEQ